MTESSTVALFSSKRMSGFPNNVSLMLSGLVPWQVGHCGNQGCMDVAAHTLARQGTGRLLADSHGPLIL